MTRRVALLLSLVAIAAALAVLTLGAGSAGAAIVFEEGPDTVSTSKFEIDFGDDGGTVEWVRELKWRNSAGTLSGDLTAESGVAGGVCGGAPGEFWGQSYGNEDFKGPGPVATGAHGNWGARGSRSVEINSVLSTVCSGDTPGIPVRTRYTFFDSGPEANMIRVERRWSFAANQLSTNPAQGMRTYVPRFPTGTHNQEIYPNQAETALNTDGIGEVLRNGTAWNQRWFAINSSATNSGVLILRDPASTAPASLRIDYDGNSGSNNSGISLDRPQPGGWLAPITETEYLCFYDSTSWPVAERSPTRLPDGCAAKTPPINLTPPTISAGAGNPTDGESFAATPGTWDNADRHLRLRVVALRRERLRRNRLPDDSRCGRRRIHRDGGRRRQVAEGDGDRDRHRRRDRNRGEQRLRLHQRHRLPRREGPRQRGRRGAGPGLPAQRQPLPLDDDRRRRHLPAPGPRLGEIPGHGLPAERFQRDVADAGDDRARAPGRGEDRPGRRSRPAQGAASRVGFQRVRGAGETLPGGSAGGPLAGTLRDRIRSEKRIRS